MRSIRSLFEAFSRVTLALILCCLTVAVAQGNDEEELTPSWDGMEDFLLLEEGGDDMGWTEAPTKARPGAYWWWPGSAVTKEDLTWNLETYRKAGWGNMGVIGIYGVRGEEERFIDIFSPNWFEIFNHAIKEAERLGMNIDLTPSSGWRMGGPHITVEHAEQSFRVENGKILSKRNGAKVKRAGPGGQGLTANPYSWRDMKFHLDWVDQGFEEGHGLVPRAFYYDSFENPGNWCDEFLPTFEKLRGYKLEEHAEALAGNGDEDEIRRVVCDYRETLSDLLIGCVEEMVLWGEKKGSQFRMQAHGAPANLLDMYAAAQIPETEVFGATVFDIPGYRREEQWIREDRQSDLVNRFASSAAHVAGRNLVISESFTWLRNHYHTALSHIKAESDNLWLNGINGIYYHGICFAPKEAPWPGWLFYASTEANCRNSIFRDVPGLNAYMTRCQAELQKGRPANDVLLYWPIYDLWMGEGRKDLRFSVHHPEWIEGTPAGEAGQWMMDQGFTFDFVSDQQLDRVKCEEGMLLGEGDAEYRCILLPQVTYLRLETMEKLLAFAKSGATILFWKGLPQDVPGWSDCDKRRDALKQLLKTFSFDTAGDFMMGQGRLVMGKDLETLLMEARVRREPMVDLGLQFIRRETQSHRSYFIVNHTASEVEGWVPLSLSCASAVLMDPMTGRTGLAALQQKSRGSKIYLQMQPGETRILRAFPEKNVKGQDWAYTKIAGEPVAVKGSWKVSFVDGGPTLPEAFSTTELGCWTKSKDEEADRFAGAARYTIEVDVPEQEADGWLIDLGDVRESARVWVNGEPAGFAVAHPFRVDLRDLIRPGKNEIAIEVTNLSVNRIRDLDIRGVDWKKFHDINFVHHTYKPFDASGWDLKPSGLLGPVRLLPYKRTVLADGR